MPIWISRKLERLDEDRFREIDYKLMGCAYQVQNEFGRLLNEKIYQKVLADFIKPHYACHLESPVKLLHKGYVKQLKMDLVVADALVCELKVAERLTDSHKNQLIQYLLLSNATRGKLINFGSKSIEGVLVSTEHSHDTRHDIMFNYKNWGNNCETTTRFADLMVDLVNDWGGFLSGESYTDAMTFLLGGEQKVVRQIEVCSHGRVVFHQKARLIAIDAAFKITTLKDDIANYRDQLIKFLSSTNLKKILWVNFNKHEVVFELVEKID